MKTKVMGLMMVLSLTLVGCTPPKVDDTKTTDMPKEETTKIANPASENCDAVGGDLKMADVLIDGEKFGQYGVCEFDDGRLCEEWALFNGDCPVGGVKVTGYVSEAGKFCAITGGEYAATGQSGETFEQGTCTGKTGVVCEVWDYYRGVCSIR